MDRDTAWALVCEFIGSDSLRRHALAVEACMEAYAQHFGEDVTVWALTGLLHDFDWEIHPTAPDHPVKGEAILAARGVSAEIRRAILSHADYTGVSRESRMEKALFACDELAGFLTAASLVRPSKSILDLEVKSVRKRMKDASFAKAVNRDDIVQGAQALGVPLDDHIAFCIEAMRQRATELDLRGGSAG